MNTQPGMFLIADRPIGADHPPFVIAEMSGNHNQSIDRALELVAAAANAGAHGLKLQTYTADTMTLPVRRDEFVIQDPDSLWHGQSLYDLYEQAHTPWDWHQPIFEAARKAGMIPFSTPFDETAVDFLESLDVPCYKVASFENTDLPLIRRVAATGKPIIMSTGMASQDELITSVHAARESGCEHLVLLKCTSTYPALPTTSNIRTIPAMREQFGCQIGLSDHTMGVGVSVAAVAMGATVIEKHFTLNRADGGVDADFSLEPAELAALVTETERAWQGLGTITYGTQSSSEDNSRRYRRSLYFCKDLAAGTTVGADAVRAVRPGLGLPPGDIDQVIGCRLSNAVTMGTPVSWDLLER